MNPESNTKTQKGDGGQGSIGGLADVDLYPNVPPRPFPALTRYITSHNGAREAIFSDALPAAVEEDNNFPGITMHNCYTTRTCAHPQAAGTGSPDPSSASTVPDERAAPSLLSCLPDEISKGDDIAFYSRNHPVMDRLATPHGSVLRILDFKPGAVAPMHRTLSLDYAIVLEGAVEAILDSGDTRTLEKGCVMVQRGTMHAWREATGKDWARVAFVVLGFGDKGLQVAQDQPAKPRAVEHSEAGDVPEWKRKNEARNEGKELKEWVPWMEDMPVPEMIEEVSQAAEKGKEIRQQAAANRENEKGNL